MTGQALETLSRILELWSTERNLRLAYSLAEGRDLLRLLWQRRPSVGRNYGRHSPSATSE